MQFEESYFQGEYRDDFYIGGMVKRSWAAELEVLSAISEVCRKYQIQYYADWGTLLGAVRHKGFVPWDDDLDICMKREDYWKFLSVAKKELPAEYMVLSTQNQEGSKNMLIRIVNSAGIRFDEQHLTKFHGCPYVVGIDIFPLDYLPEKETDRRAQCEMIKSVLMVPQLIEQHAISEGELSQLVGQIQETYGITFHGTLSVCQQLYALGEQLCGLYGESDGYELTSMMDYVNGWDYRIPKECYDSVLMMPFEQMMIPVPAGYETVLEVKYKNWKKIVRGGGSHEYPFFKSQEHTLRNYIAQNNVTVPEILAEALAERKDDGKMPVSLKNISYLSVRKEKYYCVDKTMLLKSLLDAPYKLTLFAMPPKTGKSFLFEMLGFFYVSEPSGEGRLIPNTPAFSGTQIMRAGESYFGQLGQYPLVWFRFQDLTSFSYEQMRQRWETDLMKHFQYYEPVLNEKALTEQQKSEYLSVMDRESAKGMDMSALRLLMECLFWCYGRKVIVLLEDYDVLLEKNFEKEDYPAITDFLGELVQTLFVQNKYLERGVVMAKSALETDTIFGKAGDLHIVSALDGEFAPYFSYTEEEVTQMFGYYNIQDYLSVADQWFGKNGPDGKRLYLPWDINNFVMNIRNGAKEPRPYFVNAYPDEIAGRRLRTLKEEQRAELKKLVEGGTLTKEICVKAKLERLLHEEEGLWEALFFAGYVEVQEYEEAGDKMLCTIKLPNQEIREFLSSQLDGGS